MSDLHWKMSSTVNCLQWSDCSSKSSRWSRTRWKNIFWLVVGHRYGQEYLHISLSQWDSFDLCFILLGDDVLWNWYGQYLSRPITHSDYTSKPRVFFEINMFDYFRWEAFNNTMRRSPSIVAIRNNSSITSSFNRGVFHSRNTLLLI